MPVPCYSHASLTSAYHLIQSGTYALLAINLFGTILPYVQGKGGAVSPTQKTEIVGLVELARGKGMKIAYIAKTDLLIEDVQTMAACAAPTLCTPDFMITSKVGEGESDPGVFARLLDSSGLSPDSILYFATDHFSDRQAAMLNKVPLVYFNSNEDDALLSLGKDLPDDVLALRVLCDEAMDSHAQNNRFDRAVLLALFCRPTVATRVFVYRLFLLRLRERGLWAYITGMQEKLWRLGDRDHTTFCALMGRYITQPPTARTWAFLDEALFEAEKTCDPAYAIKILCLAHELVYISYNAGIPYFPFQGTRLLSVVGRLVEPLRPQLLPLKPRAGRTIKLCYVLAGEVGELYSPICDSVLALAESHNPACFQIAIASCHPRSVVMSSVRIGSRLAKLEAHGVQLIFNAENDVQPDPVSAILDQASRIAAQNFDAVLFAILTNMPVILAMLRPARLLVGIGFGDIDIYSSPVVDFCAQWIDYPVMDGLCTTYRLPDSMPSDRFHAPLTSVKKEDLGVPEGGVLILSSGRSIKYKAHNYWRVVSQILSQRPDAHLAAIGPTYNDLREWVDAHLSPDLLSRVHFLGWRSDHLEVLASADIILDTIPMGGGFNLSEGMNLGLPTVLCHNRAEDFLTPYGNEKLLPIGEILTDPALSFDWDDESGIVHAVLRLIDDPVWRGSLGQQMKDLAARRMDMKPTVACLEAHILDHLDALESAARP